MLFKNTFFWNVFFQVSSQNRLPKLFQIVSISLHWELQADAMSPLCGIFPNRVFERPYSDLTTFSHVSCTLKLNKTSTKALKSFLAAHCEKTRPKILPGTENPQNTIPIEVQMDDLAIDTPYSFFP